MIVYLPVIPDTNSTNGKDNEISRAGNSDPSVEWFGRKKNSCIYMSSIILFLPSEVIYCSWRAQPFK